MVARQVYNLSPSLSHMLGKRELTRPAAMKELYVVAVFQAVQGEKLSCCVNGDIEKLICFGLWQLGLREAARAAGP